MKEHLTILFAGGLATKGRSERLLRQTADNLNRKGYNLSVERIQYPSHQQAVIEGFERDVKAIQETVEKKNGDGALALCGVCYGSYLYTRAQIPPGRISHSFLIEPYFGLPSLHWQYQKLAGALRLLPERLRNLAILPVTDKGVLTNLIKLDELREFLRVETEIPAHTKTLVFQTGYHHFFNQAHIAEKSKLAKIAEERLTKEIIRTSSTELIEREISRFLN